MIKIKIIGCGGIGLHLMEPLCRYLQYEFDDVSIDLIDGDTFEEKNVKRQSFSELGNKAEVAAETLRSKFDKLEINAKPYYINEQNALGLIDEWDVVMLCVDNHKTRKIVNDRAAELQNIAIISGGNEYEYGDIFVHIREGGVNDTMTLAEQDPRINNPTDQHPEEKKNLGCGQIAPSAPQLIVTNFMAAANMLSAFYGLQIGVFQDSNIAYDKVMFDVKTNTAKSVTNEPAR